MGGGIGGLAAAAMEAAKDDREAADVRRTEHHVPVKAYRPRPRRLVVLLIRPPLPLFGMCALHRFHVAGAVNVILIPVRPEFSRCVALSLCRWRDTSPQKTQLSTTADITANSNKSYAPSASGMSSSPSLGLQ